MTPADALTRILRRAGLYDGRAVVAEVLGPDEALTELAAATRAQIPGAECLWLQPTEIVRERLQALNSSRDRVLQELPAIVLLAPDRAALRLVLEHALFP